MRQQPHRPRHPARHLLASPIGPVEVGVGVGVGAARVPHSPTPISHRSIPFNPRIPMLIPILVHITFQRLVHSTERWVTVVVGVAIVAQVASVQVSV